jgi:hypothetical protein
MAVSKKILRSLLGVRLARIELVESSGTIAKAIYSVSMSGLRTEMRYFPHLDLAESFFYERVREAEAGAWTADAEMPDILSLRTRALKRRQFR